MTATPLPVPTLDETLRRLLRAASAIVDAGTLAATERAAARFREGNGPWLQAALEDFARQEHDAGRSWLSEAWFSGYFRGRGPLALGSNVSFQLAFPAGPGDSHRPGTASDAAAPAATARAATPPPGVDRAARILHRIAAVHLAQAGGRTAPEVDARDNALSMDQWAALNGGLRHPREDADAFLPCELDAARREVGILHCGRLFAVPVSDDAGRPLPARRLAELLGDVVGTAGRRTRSGRADETLRDLTAPLTVGGGGPAELGFADLSSLGSADLAAPMERLLADPHNAATYRRLADLLFVAGLAEEAADDAEHLRAFAFDAGRAWARKPLSYEVGLADEWACVHVEHSIIDGATLLEAVRRMQEADPEAPSERPAESAAQPTADPSAAAVPAADADAEPPASDASDDARQEGGSDPARSEEPPAPAELTWRLAPEVLTALRGPLEDYRRRAARLRVALVRVPRVPEERLPFPMSADGLQQLIMTVAQLLTYGRVRSVYESVDTRAFQAGRTECLRPVTPEAIAFARSLLAGRAERDGLAEALAAHRDWVKACKTGRGVDRHLTGLEEAARRLDIEDAFFADESLARLRADFLSTTSLGTADRIVRYAFAPSLPHGFGVSYTRYPESFEYCLAYDAEEAERPRLFRSNLAEAAGLLARFIAAVAPY